MAEHCLCKAGVRGSIPLVSTTIFAVEDRVAGGVSLLGSLVPGVGGRVSCPWAVGVVVRPFDKLSVAVHMLYTGGVSVFLLV